MAIDPKDYPVKVKQNLRANEKHDKFYYLFKHEGKQHKGLIDYSKKTWSKRDRIRFAEDELSRAKVKAESVFNTDATLDDIVNMYLDALPEGKYKSSHLSYYKRKIQKALGKRKASDVLPIHIERVIKENIKNGDSPRTAKSAIDILSPSFNKAKGNRIVVFNPCENVSVKLPKTKKIVVNATDRLTLIYKTVMDEYKDDPFYRAFFLLAIQGRRKGEVINMRWEDISFEYDYYLLLDTKNNEEQKIFLPPNVKDSLLEFNSREGWVFESPVVSGQRISDAKRQTAKLKKRLGPWFTMHYTRNVMVSAMAEQGVDAIHMSGALGHADPNTITKYLTMNYLQGTKIASGLMQG